MGITVKKCHMITSGNDCWNSVCFSCCRKADNELADVTLSDRLFRNRAAATGNVRPPMVDSLNGGIRLLLSGFQAVVTLTLTLRVIRHTVVHESSTSIYIPNVIEIGRKNFFVDGLTAGTPPSSRSRDIKTRTNIKNTAEQIKILCSSLRIGGHLPAPIVNGGEDRP